MKESKENKIPNIDSDEYIKTLKDTIKKLTAKNEKHITFFENAPIALWIEDFSGVKKYLDKIVKEKNTNIKSFITKNPNFLQSITSKLESLIVLKDINETSVRLYKAKNKQHLLENVSKVFTDKSKVDFSKLLNDVFLGEVESSVETVNNTLEGEEINVLIKISAKNGFEQTFSDVIVSIQNITDRFNSRKELENRESRYRKSQEISKTGSWDYDFDTNILLYSDEAYKIAGISNPKKTKLSLEYYLSFVHKDDKKVVGDFNLKSLLKNPVQTLQYRITTKEGELKYIHEKRSAIIEGGKVKKIIGAGQDITEMVLAEQKLNATKNLLSNTLTSIQDGFVILDYDLNYMYLNTSAEKLLGKKTHELIGKNIWLEFPKKERDLFFDKLQEVLKNKKAVSFENYFTPWERWFENRVIPSKDGILMFFHEITSTKINEKKLKTAYNIINKSSSVAVLSKFEYSFPVEFVSENTFDLTGYIHTDFSSNKIKIFEIIHPDDLNSVVIGLSKFGEPKSSDSFYPKPFRIITKNKKIKWVKATFEVIRNAKNIITHIQGIVADVTERKKVEDENKKHLFAVEQSANIITITNTSGDIEYLNPKFTEVYGYTKADVLGKNYSVLNSTNQPKEYYNELWRVITKGNTWKGEMQNKSKNGKLIWVRHTITPIKNDSKKIVNYIAISEDITEQKKTADLLYESNQRIKDQFNNTPLASIIWDIDFNVLEWNTSAHKIFGYTTEEAIGNPIKDLITPLHLVSEMKKKLEKLMSLKEGFRGTNENITKNGKIITCNWYNVAIKDANGFVVGMASLVEDITERINTEKIIEKSEKKYRDLFEKSVDSVFVIKNGNFIDCNNATLRLFGHKNKQSMLKVHPSHLSPETQNDGSDSFLKAEEMMKNAIEKGSSRFRWDHQKKNGTIFPAEVSLTRINDYDNKPLIHAVVQDISDRVKNEKLETILYNISKAALKTSGFKEFSLAIKDQLHKIINTNNFYIALYDEKTDMISTPVFIDEKEQGVEDFPAKGSLTGYVIKTKKSLMLTSDSHKQLVKTGKVELVGEYSEIWIGAPLKIKEKIFGAIVVQSYDDKNAYTENDVQLLEFVADQISTSIQRKNAENELKMALVKAQESDILKSSFLANMSHEIRTPMNGIIGFSELFLETGLTDSDRQKYASIVINSSKQLLSIVNDILDISKIEAGVVKLNYENANLNRLLDGLTTFYKPKAKELNLELNCVKALKNFDSLIKIDQTKLRQVLSNLMSNAFKFTEKGSVEFGYHLIGENLQFYVKDTGTGIDKNIQDKIFDRFIQANTDLSKKLQGTGLGLAISKKFVELFKGKIWLESNKNGTTVYFTIPYVKAKESQITSVIVEHKKEKKLKNQELTILVAEDEEYNMMYITELFSKTNYKIIEAENGKKAVELSMRLPEISLVLMDIKMPIMNGNEAMKLIKKDRPLLPVIALSAFAMQSDKEEALKIGFDAYLTKPIDKKELFSLLNEYGN